MIVFSAVLSLPLDDTPNYIRFHSPFMNMKISTLLRDTTV